MQRDFAFLQLEPGRLFVGWGPFERLPFRRPSRPAFFLTDFFLDDPAPWLHPTDWHELEPAAFAHLFEERRIPSVTWSEPELATFRRLFDSAHAAMASGDFQKIVPVIFEEGGLTEDADWGHFLDCVGALQPGLFAYGASIGGRSVVGATPELLFRTREFEVQTMALAGTRPTASADELLSDAKELREHRLVVEDIVRRLAPFGNVEHGPIGIARLPRLAHLATPIRFRQFGGPDKLSFADMVRRLHPTAALGVWPRSEAGERWLREADRGVHRGGFGAPFGIELADGNGVALVAIRNVEWSGDRVRIGSGAGLLPESVLEREFEELRQKREQVKAMFRIGSACQTSIPRGA